MGFGHVRSDTAETEEGAGIVKARGGGEFPPARLACDGDRKDEVAKVFPVFQLVGQDAQGRREVSGFPRIARKNLKNGLGFDLFRLKAQGIGKARRHMGEAL